MTGAAVLQPTRRARLVALLLNPYAQIAIWALLIATAELLLKKGASSAPHVTWLPAWAGAAALASVWTWLGIIAYIASFVSWLYVLRLLPLAIAFAMINVVQVLVPLGATAFLGEAVNARRWLGIAIILVGLTLVVRTVARLEQRL
jgi:drug/metabolite transporter (DMT)-like permease